MRKSRVKSIPLVCDFLGVLNPCPQPQILVISISKSLPRIEYSTYHIVFIHTKAPF